MLAKILFLLFVLPIIMIKELFKMVTKGMTEETKKKWLWRIPYLLIFILIIAIFVFWNAGYRWN